MEPLSIDPRQCSNCGAALQPDHRFCPNCGMAVPPVQESRDINADVEATNTDAHTDPSTLDTQQHRQTSSYPQPANIGPAPFETHGSSEQHDPGHPTWGTPETIVQPESGNRTLWLIIGIIAFIVIVCCCVLPLGLAAISNFDTAFQEQLRSVAILAHA